MRHNPELYKSIWIPTRKGVVSVKVWKLSEAIKTFDSRLDLGFNNDSGEWCVFYCVSRMQPHIPIFGLGKEEELPESKELLDRLDRSDAKKYGETILNDMNARNAKNLLHYETKVEDGTWALVDSLDSFYRRMGTHPTKTPYIDPTHKRTARRYV